MQIQLQIATADDAAGIVSLRNAASRQLTSVYGEGPWSGQVTEKGVLFEMRRGTTYIARVDQASLPLGTTAIDGRLVATVTLATRKPWAIDTAYFTPSTRPLYLTSMIVDPTLQRTGIGRACIAEARRIAVEWPADVIRLDAYDAEAGAGEFYRKCNFLEVGRVIYRNCPLIYYEMRV